MIEKNYYSTKEVYSKNDYVAGELDIPKARNSFWDYLQQFNQYNRDKYGCGYHASIAGIADNYGKGKDWKDLLDKAEKEKYEYGYQDKLGMYAYRAVDLARNIYNSNNPDDPVISYRVTMGSAEMEELLDKGYSVSTGYRGNKKYNEDKADGHLDEVEFGKATYGHMIRLSKKGNDKYVVDNYYQSEEWDQDDNVYSLESLKTMVDNGTYFKNGFVFILKNDIMTQQEKDISMIKYALDKGITNNIQNLEDIQKGDYNVDVRMALMTARVHKDLSNKINK